MNPLSIAAVTVAYNAAHTRMAVFDAHGRLAVYQREPGSKSWTLSSSLATNAQHITSMCWAPTEFGGVIAGGMADGSVMVWQEAPGGEQAWRLAVALKVATLAVQDLAFAPPVMGPLLAVAYADGFVRFFEASSLIAASSWELQNYFRVGGGAATALSWRQPAPSLLPLLMVGTATAGAQVWVYQQQLMRWEQAATLGSPQDYGGQPVADVAWAPAMGRPCDVAAVAAGPTVLLWELQGVVDRPHVEQLARLQHAASVWQVEWNVLGSWLAASTEGREVCMWRPDLSGEWLLLSHVVGNERAVAA